VADTLGVNAFGELESYTATYNTTTDKYVLTYDRDALGRVIRKSEKVGAASTKYFGYAYDDNGRLEDVYQGTSECDPLSACGTPTSYSYDDNGNRGGCYYDYQDRMTSCGATSYTYTDWGALASKGTTNYTYDLLGNLRKVDFPGGTSTDVDYVIDGFGRRVGKKVGGTLQKQWIYRDRLNPVAELDASGNVVAVFVYGTKQHVPDYMIVPGTTDEIYRLISDQLGSVRLVIDVSDGSIVQEIEYDAWGNATLQQGSWNVQPFGFAGGLYDADTGLVRFGARDYDPEVGRWTAKDPIGFGGGQANLYEYVGGDSVNNVDPSGQVVKCGAWGCGGGLGGPFGGTMTLPQTGPGAVVLLAAAATAWVWAIITSATATDTCDFGDGDDGGGGDDGDDCDSRDTLCHACCESEHPFYDDAGVMCHMGCQAALEKCHQDGNGSIIGFKCWPARSGIPWLP
jgi:RHS repeat-associated protein